MNLIPYTASMEYTHVDNIDGMAMTNAAYARIWPRFENFPTSARGCATRVASMIKVGFVIHDPFDSCFKMDDALRTAWNRCAYYLGTFDGTLADYRARLGQPICAKGQMQMTLD
jgi:hypothetical protein